MTAPLPPHFFCAFLFAAVTLCRMTGDRLRDVGPEPRARLASALEAIHARPSWVRLVTEVVELERADAARVLGDTLPIGLRLHGIYRAPGAVGKQA